MSKHSYVKDEKTEQIRNEIASNSTMQLLIQQIKSGWPSEGSSVPPELKPYIILTEMSYQFQMV